MDKRTSAYIIKEELQKDKLRGRAEIKYEDMKKKLTMNKGKGELVIKC